MVAGFNSSYSDLEQRKDDIIYLLNRMHCCAIGSIVSINNNGDGDFNYIMVKLGWDTVIDETKLDTELVLCPTAEFLHMKIKYKVGDMVFIAYTDKNAEKFFYTGQNDIERIDRGEWLHQHFNGFILFPITMFTSEDNENVRLYNDEAFIDITTQDDNTETITIENDPTTITIEGGQTLVDTTDAQLSVASGTISGNVKGSTFVEMTDDKIDSCTTSGAEITLDDKISIKNGATDLKTLLATTLMAVLKTCTDSTGAPITVPDEATFVTAVASLLK